MGLAYLDFFSANPSEMAAMAKLGVACLLGGILGLQREITHHPAGLRTHMLVSLGSAGFMLTGFFLAAHLGHDASLSLSSIIQGVITGMGFIGAGAIMKEGMSIHGITTAASLWVSSSVGLMCASGAFVLAACTTLFTLVALLLSGPARRIKLDEKFPSP